MGEKKKAALRFNGYDDPWEQRKLGEIAEKVAEKNTHTQYIETFTNSAEFGIISQREFFDHSISKMEKLDGYYVVHNEDFVYNPRISVTAPVGPINRNKTGRTGVMSPLYTVFRPRDVDNTYLEHFFKSRYWHSFMNYNGDSGARSDRFSIKDNVFFEMPIPTPDIDEQNKIGEYLTNLDNLITLHQRKYDKLINVKKSMLEKMFPKNGCDIPEIRFDGFTDPWEQRKLGDIYQKIRNAFVGTASPYYVDNGHFYLESNNVKDGQINRNTEIFINDEFYDKQKDNWLHTGDIVMVQSGHVGHTAVIPENLDNTAAHALIIIANPVDKTVSQYVNYYFQTKRAKEGIDNITTGNTIKHILSSAMKKFEIMLPQDKEQQMIADYFEQLDNLITLHQRELEKLQNIKKSCLEKMFV